MKNNNYNKHEPLNPPTDINLPFFAYGIFKPGQLAYSKIRNHIDEVIPSEINYPMRLRDGVPILIDKESNFPQTKGYLLTFRKGHERETYNIISKTLLKKLYEWDTIQINGKDVNVVFGVNPNKGSNYFEYSRKEGYFDGRDDPLFNEALELIERNLNAEKNPWSAESFFELQMNYMLLWSAIERYSSLKYNKRKKSWNNERFSNEKAFKQGIMKFEGQTHRPVYSTENLQVHEFNVKDPLETLNYYYTFRCNIVHKGKSMYGDYEMLRQATEELLEIFNDVLDNTFDKEEE